MKQTNLFGEIEESENGYTKKTSIPLYEPNNKKPYVLECYDDLKTKKLINEINNSDIDKDVKAFLISAAYRHVVFNYSKIADFYANSEKNVQELMEKSALIIIDFDKAIEYGYVKLSQEIFNQYLNSKENEK